MKYIAVANTPYQLLVMLQLMHTYLCDDIVDIILTDHAHGMEKYAASIEQEKLFRNVYYIPTAQEQYHSSRGQKLLDVFEIGFSSSNRMIRKFPEKDEAYDGLFHYNLDLLAISLFDHFSSKKETFELNMYEEGFLSYGIEESGDGKTSRKALLKKLRKIGIKKDWEKYYNNYYCFFPALVKKKERFTIKRIPKIDRKNRSFVEMVNRVFQYQPETNEYKQKYICFATCYQCDENLVYRHLADIVGTDQVIIKTHPRILEDTFKEIGLQTNQDKSIPWEVVQINHDFREKVFVSVNSSCACLASAILGDEIKAIYIYRCVELKDRPIQVDTFHRVNKNLEDYLQKFHAENRLMNTQVAEDRNDFFERVRSDMCENSSSDPH